MPSPTVPLPPVRSSQIVESSASSSQELLAGHEEALEALNVLVFKDAFLECMQPVFKDSISASYEVVDTPKAYSVLQARVQSMQPDCVLLMLTNLNEEWQDWLQKLAAEQAAAVVVWLESFDHRDVSALSEIGVSGYLVGYSAAKTLLPTLSFASAQHRKMRELQKALETSQARLQGRQWVEKAKGLIMQQHGISEHQAYSQLRTSAMQQGISLGELSKRVVGVFEQYA